jgi:hypothetical protein
MTTHATFKSVLIHYTNLGMPNRSLPVFDDLQNVGLMYSCHFPNMVHSMEVMETEKKRKEIIDMTYQVYICESITLSVFFLPAV